MYKEVQAARLYEQIVQQIEESILTGALKEGDQLPAERDLALQFGVSRTAVREAIKALHEKGLVEPLPGRGTFVTDGSSRSMRQNLDRVLRSDHANGTQWLAEFREILEPEVAALAALRATSDDLASMKEAYAVMERSRADADAYIEADLDFHLELAEAMGNPLVLSMIDSIVEVLREQRLHTFYVKDGPAHGQLHHKQVLEAVERHDPQAAREAMRAHLTQVREDSAKLKGA